MKRFVCAILLAALGLTLVGCPSGEQEAPKPDPAQFAPKAGGGPNDLPAATPPK